MRADALQSHRSPEQTIMSAPGDAMRIGLVAGLTFFALTYMVFMHTGFTYIHTHIHACFHSNIFTHIHTALLRERGAPEPGGR